MGIPPSPYSHTHKKKMTTLFHRILGMNREKRWTLKRKCLSRYKHEPWELKNYFGDLLSDDHTKPFVKKKLKINAHATKSISFPLHILFK